MKHLVQCVGFFLAAASAVATGMLSFVPSNEGLTDALTVCFVVGAALALGGYAAKEA